MDKEGLAIKLIEMIGADGGYAYGGFVRDRIAGVPFEDLDLCLHLHQLFVVPASLVSGRRFIEKKLLDYGRYLVNRACFSFDKVETFSNPWSVAGYGAMHSVVNVKMEFSIVDAKGVFQTLAVDLNCPIIAGTSCSENDANVNCLKLDEHGNVQSNLPGLDIQQATQDIHNRIYREMGRMNLKRKTKMASKGYKPAGTNGNVNQPYRSSPAPKPVITEAKVIAAPVAPVAPVKRDEFPCQHCGRMNDVGVTCCWNCGNMP